WADPTSVELLEYLLPLAERAAVLILALMRPQRDEVSWHFHEAAAREYAHRYTAIALNPLHEAGARTPVANLLRFEALPERVRGLILEKAEGNPFYVEEVIRSLLDAGVILEEEGHWRATPASSKDRIDRKSTRLNSSHVAISYAVFCLKKKKKDVAGNPQ